MNKAKNKKKKGETIPQEAYARFAEAMEKVEPFIKPSLQEETLSEEIWELQSSNVTTVS